MAEFKNKTAEELRDMIAHFEGFSWGSMKTRTILKTNKKSRVDKSLASDLFGESGIVALGEKSLGVGYDYRTSVNNQREREEMDKDFEPSHLPFGKWMNGSKVIIVHTPKDAIKERYYLRVTYNSANPNKSELRVNNGKDPLGKEQRKRLHEFLPPKRDDDNTKSPQGTEKAIVVRTFDLNNVLELKFGGDTFIKE